MGHLWDAPVRLKSARFRTSRQERLMETQNSVLEAVIADMTDGADRGNFNSFV